MAHDGAPMVYLVGTAGHPHYGDEVITASWLRYYSRTMPEAEVWLDTPRPGQTAVLHGGSHPRLRCVDTLFHACWNAPSDAPADCVQFGRDVVDDRGRLAREATGLWEIRGADVIHVLGGGYVNNYWPRHVTLFGAVQRVAEIGHARTAVTGAGLTPADHDLRTALNEVLASFDVVDVRDQPSADLLGRSVPQVTATSDDSFLDLQGQPVDRRTKAANVLEIQSDLLERSLEDLVEQAIRLLTDWDVIDEEVLLLESLPPGDSAALEMLRERVPRIRLLPFELLWRAGLPVSSQQRWITTRFHSHLMASAAGAWGAALGVSGPTADQHQSLIDLGSGWALLHDAQESVAMQAPAREPYDGRFAAIVSAKRAVADTVVRGIA